MKSKKKSEKKNKKMSKKISFLNNIHLKKGSLGLKLELKDLVFLLILFLLLGFLFNNGFFLTKNSGKYSDCNFNSCAKGYVCCPGNYSKNVCLLPDECEAFKTELKNGLGFEEALELHKKPFVIRNLTFSTFWAPLIIIILIVALIVIDKKNKY